MNSLLQVDKPVSYARHRIVAFLLTFIFMAPVKSIILALCNQLNIPVINDGMMGSMMLFFITFGLLMLIISWRRRVPFTRYGKISFAVAWVLMFLFCAGAELSLSSRSPEGTLQKHLQEDAGQLKLNPTFKKDEHSYWTYMKDIPNMGAAYLVFADVERNWFGWTVSSTSGTNFDAEGLIEPLSGTHNNEAFLFGIMKPDQAASVYVNDVPVMLSTISYDNISDQQYQVWHYPKDPEQSSGSDAEYHIIAKDSSGKTIDETVVN